MTLRLPKVIIKIHKILNYFSNYIVVIISTELNNRNLVKFLQLFVPKDLKVKIRKFRPKKIVLKNYHLADIGGCWRCEAAETGEQLRGDEADR